MVQKSESRELDKVIVRLPDGMRDKLKTAAEKQNRSMNAEIVARLSGSLDRDNHGLISVWLPPELLARIEDEATRKEADPNLVILEAIEDAFPAFSFDWLFENYVNPAQSTTSEKEADRLVAEANRLLEKHRPGYWVHIHRDGKKPRVVSFGNAPVEIRDRRFKEVFD